MAAKKPLKEKVDKRRRAKVKVGVLPDGTPDYRYPSARTDAELKPKKEELSRLSRAGIVHLQDITLLEYAQLWFDTYVKGLKRAAATIEMYATALNAHILPVFGTRYIRTITGVELQAFLNTFAMESYSKVHKIKLTLTRLFKRARIDGLIVIDPAEGLIMPETVEGTRRELTEAEERAVLEVAEQHPDGLLLLSLFYTGVRIGECLGKSWGDVDWDTQEISIFRDVDFHAGGAVGKVKSKASARTIPVPDPLFEAYKSQAKEGEAPMFMSQGGGYLSKSVYERKWADLMTAIYNVDQSIEHRPMPLYKQRGRYDKNKKDRGEQPPIMMSILTPHYFRHNYATILYDIGVPLEVAADWLGHSDINVTRKIYTHLSKETRAKHSRALLNSFHGCQKVARSPLKTLVK